MNKAVIMLLFGAVFCCGSPAVADHLRRDVVVAVPPVVPHRGERPGFERDLPRQMQLANALCRYREMATTVEPSTI